MFKDSKKTAANHERVDKGSITVDVKIVDEKTDRIIFTCPSGLMLDVPSDITETDIEIIKLQLRQIELAHGLHKRRR